MKYTIALLCTILLVTFCACKKSTNSTPAKSTTTTTTPVYPYYFKFTVGGVNYNYTDSTPQYMSFYSNLAGGYADTLDFVLFPSMGLSLTWPAGDTVKESDILGLKGKTLYFSDTAITPELSYDISYTVPTWYSTDTANTNYNVKITNVVFLKNDTTLGTPVRSYVITGTCSAVLYNGITTTLLTNGSFNFIICRQNY